MRIFRTLTWTVLACGWAAGFFALASRVGGARWLAHTGQLLPAALDLLMASLCAIAAARSWRHENLSAQMMWCIAVVAGLHLFTLVGVLFINSPLGMPFQLLAHVLPTNSFFIQASDLSPTLAIAALGATVALPLASLVAALSWKTPSKT